MRPASASYSRPARICCGGSWEQAVVDERAGAGPSVVRRTQGGAELNTGHILFISRPAADRPEAMLAALKNRPILTVSDAAGFAERGGMIRFVTEQNRIRLQVNLAAAEAAHLTLSSNLFRVSRICTPSGG